MSAAESGVRALGEEISNVGLPPEVGPVVFAFTGRGKVAQGGWVVLLSFCVGGVGGLVGRAWETRDGDEGPPA